MNEVSTSDGFGTLIEPASLQIQRLLPGPIERVWAYLTESDLRKQWLAAGDMEMKVGTPFEFVWRNAELSDSPENRPEGFPEEHRLQCMITELDPPRKIAFTWGRSGGVTFELAPSANRVLLTVTHMRLPDRDTLLNVSAGWHAHLDVLAGRLSGQSVTSFWDGWRMLKAEYEKRIPV